MRLKYSLLIFLFVLGLVFRFLLIKTFPQPMAGDQGQYQEYTDSINSYGIYAHTFRLYGYPIFIFFIEKILGKGTFFGLHTWQAVQAFMDTLTAFLAFGSASLLFNKFKISAVSLLLYLFNPFTAAYAGLMLPEVLAAFLFGLFIYLCLVFILRKRQVLSIIPIGLILGYIPQVKPVFFYFSFSIFILFVIYIYKGFLINKLQFLLLLTLSFCIPFIYTVWGNYRWYNEISLTDVDKLSIENFYISLFIKKTPTIPLSFWEYPKEVQWAYAEYSYKKDTHEKRKKTQKLFIGAAIDEIKKDPLKFIKWRIAKMWYVWEKHSIFPYSTPGNKLTTAVIYWGNLLLLYCFVLGFVNWAKWELGKNKNLGLMLIFFSIYPVFYTTLVNAFTTTEERYSISVYPLIILFAGYGLLKIGKKARL